MSAPRNFGEVALLPERVSDWIERLSRDGSLPWAGLGLIRDLEAVLRLLTLVEFADFLRTHPDNELQQWADEVAEAAADRDALLEAVDAHLPDGGDATQAIAQAGETITDVRQVLVDIGALEAADQHTPVAGLLRALLA